MDNIPLTAEDIEAVLNAIKNESCKCILAFKQKEWDYIDKHFPELAYGVERFVLPDTNERMLELPKVKYELISPNKRLSEQHYCSGLKVLNPTLVIKCEEKK